MTHLSLPMVCLSFYKDKTDSVVGIWRILSNFFQLSGLQLNVEKNEFLIQSSIDFKGSQSPMKYLVSFLVTRRVSVKDCLPLLERIRPKMTT